MLAPVLHASLAVQGFEIIKAVHLDHELFSTENDLLTPSFKLKRAPLLKRYQHVITGMYEGLKK